MPAGMPALKVLSGSPLLGSGGRHRQIAAAYDHFRIDRQSNLVSPSTLAFYDHMMRPFLAWLDDAGCLEFPELTVDHVRRFRVALTEREGKHGQKLSSTTILGYHRAYSTFSAGPRWKATWSTAGSCC